MHEGEQRMKNNILNKIQYYEYTVMSFKLKNTLVIF